MAAMTSKYSKKSFIRISVPNAAKQLRDRLGKISQARLAEMVGPEVSAITVSRWERGVLMPYPKNRQKLADIALENDWWDIVAGLDVEVPFDEWMSALKSNLPNEYARWMTLTMCGLYGFLFEPDDPENPTKQEVEIARKHTAMLKIADELLDRLAEMHQGGTEVIAPPPNEYFRRFWFEFLERKTRHGKG